MCLRLPELSKFRLLDPDETRKTKLVAMTAMSGIAVQFGRPLASLLTVPALLNKLGQSGLGLWMIAMSLIGVMGTLNNGLSITLVTSVGRASGTNSSKTALSRIATAANIIAGLGAVLMLAATLPAVWLIDWNRLLGLENKFSSADLRGMLAALACATACGFLAVVPRQIMTGRLHGYIANSLDLTGVMLGCGGLVMAAANQQPLWVLALVFTVPSYALVLVGGIVYLKKHRISMFSTRHLDKSTLKVLKYDSLRMVGYQLSYSISSQSDLFLIGMMAGAKASAIYGVAQRIFSLPLSVALAINQAQWPRLAQLEASDDLRAVDRSLRLMLLALPASFTVVAAAIAAFYQHIVEFWLGAGYPTDVGLLSGMIVWVPLAIAVNIFDTALRAKNATSFLAKSMMIMAVINIAASLLLICAVGYPGAIWGTILGYTIALLIPYATRYNEERALSLQRENFRPGR